MKWEKPQIVDFSDRHISLGADYCLSHGLLPQEPICGSGASTDNECKLGGTAAGNCETMGTAADSRCSVGSVPTFCTTGSNATLCTRGAVY